MDRRAIGVFDSGLGGLTAVKKLMEVMPREDIIYFGDTGRVPYGGRSRETIIKYAGQDIEFLRKFNIKAVVAACGTVSTNGLEEISGGFDFPVMGVLGPAASAAARMTKTGRIGIIGTAASIRSGAYERRLMELLPGCRIFSRACPLLVPVIEEGRIRKGDRLLSLVADEYLSYFDDKDIDTLIMGCTHYPIIADTIAERLGGVNLIDPGGETAKELSGFLRERGLLTDSEKGSCRFYVSDSVEGFAEKADIFLQQRIEGQVSRVSIDEL